jgi:uncharacterized integral membrane protein (TIGR00698 family)
MASTSSSPTRLAGRTLPGLLPGLLLAVPLGVAGLLLERQHAMQSLHLSALTIAIVLGMLIGNLAGDRLPARLGPGVAFAQRNLLRWGVALYGLRLSFQQIGAIGLQGVVLDAVIVVGTLALGMWLGKRLGLDRDTALLTASGSAICGAAAVLAFERLLNPDPAKVAIAVASVVLFGTLDIALYPLLYPHLGLDAHGLGLYTGATVHEVAQVVAAASNAGPEVADAAVVVKLTRVMMLVPVLFVLGWRRTPGADGSRGAITVPWFALAFVGVVGLNSLLSIPQGVRAGLLDLDTLLLAAAMAALGLETRLSKLRALGPRPLLLATLLFAWLVVGGALLTHLLA